MFFCTSESTWRGAMQTGTDGRTFKINSLPACWKQKAARTVTWQYPELVVEWDEIQSMTPGIGYYSLALEHNDFVYKCKRESLNKEQVASTDKYTGGGTSAEMVRIQKHKNTSVSLHLDSMWSWKWVKYTKTPFNIWSPIKFVSMQFQRFHSEKKHHHTLMLRFSPRQETHSGVSVELTA